MPRRVLVVNHGGGVPFALRGNMVAQADWATHVADDLPLEHTDSGTQLEAAFRDLWPALRAAGWTTAWFGVDGPRRAPPRRHALDMLRAAAARPDVDVTTVLQAFDGPGTEHDALVLQEAQEHLAACTRDTVLVVNLRGCGDVTRCRFGAAAAPPDVSCCEVQPLAAHDPRTVPACVHDVVEGVSEELARANRRRFGEDPAVWRVTDAEYAALLAIARRLVDEVDAMVRPLIDDALRDGAHVALTASHSLPLGEHALRDGDAPTHVCTSSFFVCYPTVPESPDPATWADALRHFVAASCEVTLPVPTNHHPIVCATGHPVAFLRLQTQIHERTYTIIGRDGTLLCVYAEDERTNILPLVPHLLSWFQETLHHAMTRRAVTLGRRPHTTTVRPPSATPVVRASLPVAPPAANVVVAPPAPAPSVPLSAPVSTAPPATLSTRVSTPVSTASSAPLSTPVNTRSRRSSAAARPPPAMPTPANVRKREDRLNQQHR